MLALSGFTRISHHTCQTPGCTNPRYALGLYCRSCRTRRRRHGEVNQQTISRHLLKPYAKEIRQWLDQRPEKDGWGPLRGLWAVMADHAKAQHEELSRQASYRPLRKAYGDIVQVAADNTGKDADEVILTVAGMWLMMGREARRFASHKGFKVQLARQFRRHSPMHVAESWDHQRGRVKKVYRDVTPRQLEELGHLVAVGFGAACLTIIETMNAEEERARQQKLDAYQRLSVPTEVIAKP